MLGPDTPCMVGAFDGAWSLLKALTEEELAMAADPRFGGLGYSPERMDAMMAQGLDPAMAMGALPPLTPPPRIPQSKPIGAPMPSMQSMPMTPAPTMSPEELAAAVMAYQQMMGGR